MNGLKNFINEFKNLADYESNSNANVKIDLKSILKQMVYTLAMLFVLGIVMGSYHSVAQAFSAGIKLMFLFVGVLTICIPSFYVIQHVLGSKMKFIQIISVVSGGSMLSALIAFSFMPIAIFFVAIGSRYHFIQLLYLSILVFSAFWGLRIMNIMLGQMLEKNSVYPKIGNSLSKLWMVIAAFVALQLSWNLRPFVAERTASFQILGEYKGNVYTAIIYSIGNLMDNEDDEEMEEGEVKHYPGYTEDKLDSNK